MFSIAIAAVAALTILPSCGGPSWPPDPDQIEPTSRVLTPEEALRSFYLPPGYQIELVASEPFVVDPVAIDFDADGRMYVAEMRSYMRDLDAADERAPVGRVSVLQDDDGDGRMDRSTVFLDSLVLPRAVKAVNGGVLIGAPPNLIFARDTDGDLRADERLIVGSGFGSTRSNPEHNANGLVWGLDNCLYTSQHGNIYCAEDGEVIRAGAVTATPTVFRGQWGVSMDDIGRFYRNFNEDPLHVDVVPATYFARNSNLVRTRGAYEDIVGDKTVWPIRPTPGVNRGYRDDVLREDGTLASFTSAGSPVVYRGEGFPSEVQGDVFVTEPAGNLVRRFVIEDLAGKLGKLGTLGARNAYDAAEFLTSSDERFRPVNLYSGPDGALYVVDMYRGVIQHTAYLTDYLKKHILEHDLHEPVGLGRIYRIVHESMSMERPERPRLSQESTKELVDHLDHPNGWWRDTSQRLLVQRQDTSEADLLRRLVLDADEVFTRLHALWTLNGLGIVDASLLAEVLSDELPHVRASAVRLSEPRLSDETLCRALERVAREDEALEVQRQLAASVGELPWPDRGRALAEVLSRNPLDSVVVDLVVSGLSGYEADFAERMVGSRPDQQERRAAKSVRDTTLSDALAMLAAAGTRDGRRADFDRIAELAPAWAEQAIRRGIGMALPQDDDEPVEMAEGRKLFEEVCGVCHGRDGTGMEGVAPTLVGTAWVSGPKNRLIRIVIDGKEGDQLMPAVQQLDDEDVAKVLTFVRRAWGNDASPVSADEVDMVRAISSDRDRPWSEEELLEIE